MREAVARMLAGLRFPGEAGHGRDVPVEHGLVRAGLPAVQRDDPRVEQFQAGTYCQAAQRTGSILDTAGRRYVYA